MEHLRESIKQGNTILFVGAGISASLGLPTWNELINHLAHSLGYDPEVFRMYGDNLALAEYYYLKKGRIGELRSWMDCNWDVPEEKIRESTIFKKIVDLKFPLIYTTNYDHCLEKAMDIWNQKCRVIVDVRDMVDIERDAVQIIKFHGDVVDDDSIVLTERQYFERLNFDTPLDIKLRADMLGKTILFVGYSLSDINVRLLLYKLDQVWKNSMAKNRPESYIFLPKPNPVQEEILRNIGIKPIIGQDIDIQAATVKFFEDLESK